MNEDKLKRSMGEPLLQSLLHSPLLSLAKYVSKTGISGNSLSVLSLIMSLLGALALLTGKIPLAGICALSFWILDLIDGKVARIQGKQTILGAWLDVYCGITSVYVYLMAISIFIGHIYIGWLFALTYALKMFYAGGTYKNYYRRAYNQDAYRRIYSVSGYKQYLSLKGFPHLIATINETNTLFLAIFAGSILFYLNDRIFLYLAVFYIVINSLQSIAMIAIQYNKLKNAPDR